MLKIPFHGLGIWGDAALQGRSPASLGDKLSLEWVFDTGDFLKSSVVTNEKYAFVGSDDGTVFAVDLKKCSANLEI